MFLLIGKRLLVFYNKLLLENYSLKSLFSLYEELEKIVYLKKYNDSPRGLVMNLGYEFYTQDVVCWQARIKVSIFLTRIFITHSPSFKLPL